MFPKAAWLWTSFKEYVEIFSRSLKETMESREGIAYLLASCGFKVKLEEINLRPETRWKEEVSLATSG